MGKAGAIISIIAGVFATLAAIFTLFVGGVGSAFKAQGASTLVGLGWAGLFCAFAVIILGALVFVRPRGAGIALIVTSIVGAIVGGTFVAVFLMLSLAGGILAVIAGKKDAARPEAPPQVSAATAAPSASVASREPPATRRRPIWPWAAGGVVTVLVVLVVASSALTPTTADRPEQASSTAPSASLNAPVSASPLSSPPPASSTVSPRAASSQSDERETKTRFGLVHIADNDGVKQLKVDGTPVVDASGTAVQDDYIRIAKHITLPEKDVVVVYKNCSGTMCGDMGRYRLLVLTSSARSITDEFGDGRDNATIQEENGVVVVGFGANGAAALETTGLRVSQKLVNSKP